jgi:hypothetical protein
MEASVEKIINELEEKLFSKGVTLSLLEEKVSEYDRGRLFGQVQMLTKLRQEFLAENMKNEAKK